MSSSKINDFFKKGEIFSTTHSLDNPAPETDVGEETDEEFFQRMMEQANMECLSIPTEDSYTEGTPFDYIAKKMFDLTADGKIKKRILRDGDGAKPKSGDFVSINYNGYIEFQPEPFDSTYARRRPHKFDVDQGNVIPGLDCAVRSMKVKEKSQFLIHPDCAYRNLMIGRIPPNATVLFEVELIDVFDKSAIREFENLTEEEKANFSVVQRYCEASCEKAKRALKECRLAGAIKDYNKALGILLETIVIGSEDIKKRRELLYRLHSNLAVCYLKNDKPRKTIREVLDIYKLTENGELMPISAKTFYHHAKSLRILGEFDEAKKVLEKALKRCPVNQDISAEFVKLSKEMDAYKKKEEDMAKAMVALSVKK